MKENGTPFTVAETQALAVEVVKKLSSHKSEGAAVLGLCGNLGAGKTTFMQFFGEALGVQEKMVSPTFVIEKIYKLDSARQTAFDHLVHIDAYRLDDESELRTLGWDEIVANPRNIIAVEWADKIPGLLPEGHTKLMFSHHGESTRIIEITQ